MYSTFVDTPVRTLASVEPGECMIIVRQVFDAVRARCAEAGLCEGAHVQCLAASDAHLLLQVSGAPLTVFERTWARFVQVDTMHARRGQRCA